MTLVRAIGLTWRRGLVAALLICIVAVAARASSVEFVRMQVGDNARWADPAFHDSSWPVRSLREIDSQNRIIWLRSQPIAVKGNGPFGVSISALGAYQIFWNGRLMGSSGVPGTSKSLERPGLVDGHFAVPSDLVGKSNVMA